MQIEPLTRIDQIKEGDGLIISNGSEITIATAKRVKVTDYDGTEVIFKMKQNKFFNVGMYQRQAVGQGRACRHAELRKEIAMKHADMLRKKCQTIHVARRQLDLDDATYRALLVRAAGVTSSRDLKSLKDCDAVSTNSPASASSTASRRARLAPRPRSTASQLQKIEALLADMQLPWATPRPSASTSPAARPGA